MADADQKPTIRQWPAMEIVIKSKSLRLWEGDVVRRALTTVRNDASCADYMERVRWPDGFVCGSCGAKGEPTRYTSYPAILR